MRFSSFTAVFMAGCLSVARAGSPAVLFDGKTLDGWEGDMTLWHVKDGVITAGSPDKKQPRNEFLSTKQSYGDFELHVKFKLEGDPKTGFVNSGVQFRSERHPDGHEMIGYQADIGDPKYWGALYDESRRNKMLVEPDMTKVNAVLKRNDWNDYTVICRGPNIKIILNGVTTVDYTEADKTIPLAGKIGLQIHGGANTTVSFKDIILAEFK
jgi:hypothetical protein